MADDTETDRGLDALLKDASGLRPDDALIARVLRDADVVQAGFDASTSEPPKASGIAGLLRKPPSFVAALGGWGGFGGVTAAGLVGLAVGFWSPDLVDAIAGGQLSLIDGGNVWAPDVSGLALESDDV